MRKILGELNAEQRRAVTTTEGPVLVLAGAGTGKTRVITVRIAHLLDLGKKPERIMAVTFTNKAAKEMRERVAGLVGRKNAAELTIGTFHSFCARVLRTQGEKVGVPRRFAICDDADQLSAVKAALRDLHVPEATIHPRALLARISLLKNRLVTPERYLDDEAVDDYDKLVGHAYRRYEENLRRAQVLDFDDLLLRTVDLLRAGTGLLDRYHYILVDEYQDTNGPQYEIVRLLAEKRRNLCVVGDDDQSIYGWRGADVRKILDFERDFRGATVVRLETNYRSTKQILEAANRVIAHNPKRHDKALRSAFGEGTEVKVATVDDEEKEARRVVADIVNRVEAKEVRHRDCAVLFRAATQSRALEAILRAREVPYVLVGGQSFFDRKEVRDVLAFLKLMANPDDEVSLLRIVNTPARGIGKTSIDKVLATATKAGIPAAAAFAKTSIPAAAAAGYEKLSKTIQRIAKRKCNLVERIEDLLDSVDYRAEVDRCYKDQPTREARWAGVLEILNFAENYSRRTAKPKLAEFLEQLALADRDTESEEPGDRDAVTLMTLHSAKGLEFPRVYLVGLEEGLLPHERSLAEDTVEEERRLMYVGITRARRYLTITHVRKRAKYGHRVDCMPSRFLFEMQGSKPPKGWKAGGKKLPARPPRRRARR